MLGYVYTGLLIVFQLLRQTACNSGFVYDRPVKSSSFTNSKFGTTVPYNVQLKLFGNGQAFIEVAKYPALPIEHPITVSCPGVPPSTFTNWTNYRYNSVYVFRHLIGYFQNQPLLECTVSINNVSHVLVSQLNQAAPTYPSVQTHSEPFTVTPLNFLDTKGGLIQWSNQPLVTDSQNFIALQQAMAMDPLPASIYNDMVQMLGNTNVYISLTTTPSRLMRLHYQFESMDLTHVTKIFITIPPLFRDNQSYVIPVELVNRFPKIQFLFASFDLGSSMKIIGVVDYLKSIPSSNQDIVIIMDDDSVYAPSMVNTFIYQSLIAPEAVINASPFNDSLELYGLPPVVTRNIPYLKKLNRVEGFAGYAFRAGNFDTDILKAIIRKDLNIALTPCFQSDTMIVSYLFLYSGVPIYTTDVPNSPFYSYKKRCYLHQFKDFDALHLLNLDGTHSAFEINHFKFSLTLEFLARFLINANTLLYESKDVVLAKIRATYTQ